MSAAEEWDIRAACSRWRRYIQKFYQMRTQLQAISLRIQVCSLVQFGDVPGLRLTIL